MKTTSLKSSIIWTVGFASLLWCIQSYEILFHHDLSFLGVKPGSWSGLFGLFTAPLIHGSPEHLFNNTLPILILGSFILYGYPKSRWKVIAVVWLLSGVGVWLFARPSFHIGASGLTHGLFFYLFVVSLFRRDKSSIAIMMVAFFMYGGMTMTIFPREEGVSFEYHLFGAIAGVLSALIWRNDDPKPVEKTYDWETSNDTGSDDVIGDAWQQDEQVSDTEQKSHSSSPIQIERN